jgi:hypothetical protein
VEVFRGKSPMARAMRSGDAEGERPRRQYPADPTTVLRRGAEARRDAPRSGFARQPRHDSLGDPGYVEVLAVDARDVLQVAGNRLDPLVS